MRVIVIGAGLGGLALANGLRRAGLDVAVHEKDPTPVFRNQGYRIHLDTRGITTLRAVLAPREYELFVATAGAPGRRLVGLDHRLGGRRTMGLPDVPDLPGGGHLAVDRLTLRQILLSGLGDAVRFGAAFTRYTTDPSGTVTAHFADGDTATGDVLVGADGVGSPTRRQCLPGARVMDAGLRLFYGKIPLSGEGAGDPVPEDMLGLWTTVTGPDKRFVGLTPVRFPVPVEQAAAALAPEIPLRPQPSYLTCVFGARRELVGHTDEELFAMGGEQLRALALSLMDGWHPRLRTIVSSQDPATIFPITVRSSVPVPAWRTTPVTLLGDAVHAMSPAIGAGANTALRDARLLAARLAEVPGGRPLGSALRDYEREMIDYGFAAVRESAGRGHQLVGQDPLPPDAHA